MTVNGGKRPSVASMRAPICAQRLGDPVDRPAADRRVAVERERGPPAPASQPGSRRISVPALPTSIGRRARAASRRPTPRMTSSPARSSTSAPSARTPRASSSCPRRRGSCGSRTGSSAIAPSSAARCEIDLSGGGVSSPRSGPLGRSGPFMRTGEPEPARSARARGLRRSAAHPQRATAACMSSGDGASAMSAMLMPARPSVERDLGDRPRAGWARRRAARQRARRASAGVAAARGGARRAVACQASSAAPCRRRARRGPSSRRGDRVVDRGAERLAVGEVDARPTGRGSRRRRGSRRGSSGPVAGSRSPPARRAACATSTLASTCGRCETAAIRRSWRSASIDLRPRAERRRAARAGARAARRASLAVGVRYQVAPSNRSARACSTPAASAPASGWPPTKRSSSPRRRRPRAWSSRRR